ncbi:hypothetical protein DSM107007_26120 [Nostoc sp. PCC 7120 = FACHB-418]|nr:hypothetical protein DSM107007_26120 [Nostoc sp. PCC 7120 = FACHB-418]
MILPVSLGQKYRDIFGNIIFSYPILKYTLHIICNKNTVGINLPYVVIIAFHYSTRIVAL